MRIPSLVLAALCAACANGSPGTPKVGADASPRPLSEATATATRSTPLPVATTTPTSFDVTPTAWQLKVGQRVSLLTNPPVALSWTLEEADALRARIEGTEVVGLGLGPVRLTARHAGRTIRCVLAVVDRPHELWTAAPCRGPAGEARLVRGREALEDDCPDLRTITWPADLSRADSFLVLQGWLPDPSQKIPQPVLVQAPGTCAIVFPTVENPFALPFAVAPGLTATAWVWRLRTLEPMPRIEVYR